MSIFTDHRKYYQWYEREAKEWLLEVWGDLHSKKPAWLTKEVIRNIPLDLIPNIESLKGEMEMELGEESEQQKSRRRKSSVETIGAALPRQQK